MNLMIDIEFIIYNYYIDIRHFLISNDFFIVNIFIHLFF